MKKTIAATLSLFMLATSTVQASSISGIKSLNNEYREIDYKTDMESASKKFNIRSLIKEIFRGGSERNLSSLSSLSLEGEGKLTTPITQKELSWLIEHNLLSRERDIHIEGDTVTFGDIPELYFRDMSETAFSKSNFLMGLHKSTYGVLESRPISFKVGSWRNAGAQFVYQECNEVDGERVCKDKIGYRDPPTYQNVMGGDSFRFYPQNGDSPIVGEFTEGDYYLYVTPNVKELYIKSLLDKGIISKNELNDPAYVDSYTRGSKLPWDSGLPTFPMGYPERNMESSGRIAGNPLGRSFNITGVDSTSLSGPSNFTVSYRDVDFFTEEEITGMDALKLVEKILRTTEKDMTKTEAEIVSYKYGANHISKFAESDKDTLMFLTAKGILNFEDETEYLNLYLELTEEYAYKLFYRLANKEARLNFSEIQLTDSDNFWIGRGYSQYKMNIRMNELSAAPMEVPLIQTKEVIRVDVTVRNTSNYLASLWADGPSPTFKVVKIFEDPTRYMFRGKSVADLAAGDDYVDEVVKDSNGNFEVTFKILSSSGMNALKAINSQITFTHQSVYQSASMMTVSKVNHMGKDLTLIPASALEALTHKGTRIEILEDKVLRNSSTGATAVLLPENNIALIGTHVISSEDLMVTPIGGEAYYNLEIIRTLLPNVYISELDKSSIYLTDGLVGEKLAPIRSLNTNSFLGETYLATLDATRDNSDDSSLPSSFIPAPYASLSHMGLGTNIIIKDFTVKDDQGEETNFKMIIHLNFKLPNADGNFPNPIYNSANPTHEEVHKFLYTPPLDKDLYEAWWNNLELTNGLLNSVYGSTGVTYVDTGWIYPSIHILYDKTNGQQIKLLKDFFIKAGNSISDEWFQKFTGHPKAIANAVVAGNDTGVFDPVNGEGKFYPKKRLVAGMFPLWVHAMFNNPYDEPELDPNYETFDEYGMPVQQTIPERANTLLWRSMMETRTIFYDSSVSVRKGYKVYELGKYAYAVTNGAQVMMRLDDANEYMYMDKVMVTSERSFNQVDGIYLRTRTESNSLDSWAGRIVRYSDADSDPEQTPRNKIEFYVRSVNGNKISIVDLSRGSGTPVFDGNKIDLKGRLYYNGSGDSSSPMDSVLKSRYETLKGLFTSSRLKGYGNSLTKWGEGSSFIGNVGNRTQEPYISLGTPYREFTDKTKLFYTSDGMKAWFELDNKPVNGYVGITLDRNLWTITESGDLRPRKTYPFLNIGSIYNTSITRNIIDSLIMNYNGTISVNELTEGSKLVIDDITFIKNGDHFVSEPIKTDVNSIKVINDPANKKAVESWMLQLLTGKSIKVANTSNVMLSKFITVEGLGEILSMHDIEGQVLGLKEGAISLGSRKGSDISFKKYDQNNPSLANGVVIKVKFDDILLARPFYTSNTYELLNSTSQFSEGVVRNLPFFDEDLSLGSALYDVLSGQQEVVRALNEAPQLRDKFLGAMRSNFKGDLGELIKAFICIIISFLIVLSWVVYFLTRSGAVTNLLYELGSGRRGKMQFDIVKIASFGIYDTENEMTIVHLIIFNISAFLIMYLVWFYA